MSLFEEKSGEYIPYTPESKHYLSIAREMIKLAEQDEELASQESKSEREFISLAKEVENIGESGKLYPEDKKNWSERFLSSLKSFKRLAKKTARIGVLAGILTNAMPANIVERTSEKLDIPSVENTLKMQETKKAVNQEIPWYKGWRLNQIVLDKDKDGNLVFNPLGLVFPVQIEKVGGKSLFENLKFNIPQEYARLFDTAEPLRPEDYEKLKNYINKELQKSFEDKLRGLNFSVETRQEISQEKKNPQIEKISVSGFASPEGLQQKGPQTIEQGNIDEENIKLARLRAEKALGITVEDLEELGISKEVINKALTEIKAEELQFTTKEFTKLTVLSNNWPGSTPLEKIFNMIVDYNDGKIKDPDTAKDLHNILASKRMVEIEIQTKGEEKTIYTVPLPLLLGLLPFIRRRKKEESEESTKESTEESIKESTTQGPNQGSNITPIPTPINPFSESSEPIKSESTKIEPIIEPIKVDPLPVKPEEDANFPEKVKISLCDDIYSFFDNADTIRRGLNYRELCDRILSDFNKFESDYDREQYLARELLRLWREHDIVARKEAGWMENIDFGLDYENQPKQILWALAHAKVLLRIVKAKKELSDRGENVDYINLMSKDIENYMMEKVYGDVSEKNIERVEENQESIQKNEEKEENKNKLKTAVELAMEGKIAWKKEDETE